MNFCQALRKQKIRTKKPQFSEKIAGSLEKKAGKNARGLHHNNAKMSSQPLVKFIFIFSFLFFNCEKNFWILNEQYLIKYLVLGYPPAPCPLGRAQGRGFVRLLPHSPPLQQNILLNTITHKQIKIQKFFFLNSLKKIEKT